MPDEPVFFTADLHLFHTNILAYSRRPFDSVEHMHEAMIHNWNAVVPAHGTVWVLGDFALGKWREALALLPRFNGTKRLIQGNHDACWSGRIDGWKHTRAYLDAGFEVVAPFARTKLPPVRPGEKARKVALSHFPYDGDHVEDERHTAFRLRDEGIPLIHGHVHESYTLGRSAKGTIGVNVGVDRWNYTPVPAETVARLIDEADTHTDPVP